MDPDQDEPEVFSDTEEPSPLEAEEVDQLEEDGEKEEEEEEDDDEEEDARIFNAWMQRYRGGECQNKTGENVDEAGDAEGGRPESRSSLETPMRMRTDRRASLPCPSTLSAMQLSRLHLSTKAPVTARVLLHRTSSRRLLPSPQESIAPTAADRRPSLITTIPEVIAPEKRAQFRRRNVMSLSDAYSVCLICHNDLSQGAGGTTELQCTHTFHKECIEEWFWRKQSCPTCHVQVSMAQPIFWNSSRVKVP